jgi:hypothetical protein
MTQKTAAHTQTTAAAATRNRRQAAVSSIVQLSSMPAFRVETSWRSRSR